MVDRNLHGRRQIFTNEVQITRDNILNVIGTASAIHRGNVIEINYLYDYYSGKQEIRNREKIVRPEICSKITENRALEIVNFKVGYLLTDVIQYVSNSADKEVSDRVSILNRMFESKGKMNLDKDLFDWDMIAGTAYRVIVQDEYANVTKGEAPFDVFSVDPRDAFVVYSSDFRHRPMLGVIVGRNKEGQDTYTCYTNDRFFKIVGDEIVDEREYPFGIIPVIEYPANKARLGAFEPILDLLDELNNLDSSRSEGIEQFIQSLLVVVNANLPEGTTGNVIRENGMIVLKSTNENKAEIKVLSEQLDQTQTQVFKDDIYKAILSITGMPSVSDGNTSDSSNNGATILKNGWRNAEATAKSSEIIFDASETQMLKLVLRICRDLSDLDIDVRDISINFPRRRYEDALSKVQALTTMLGCDLVHPQVAYEIADLLPDIETAYQMGMEWYEKKMKDNENPQSSENNGSGEWASGYYRMDST